jgi:hypothetical protein
MGLMKRILPVVAAALLLLPATAFADVVTFSFGGGTAVAYWDVSNVGDPATLTGVSGATVSFEGDLGTVVFTTGQWNDDTYGFDPGGSIVITSNGAQGLPSGVIFEGTFSSGSTWEWIGTDANGGNVFVLSGQITGTISPALLAALGISAHNGVISGHVTITFTNGGITGIVLDGAIISQAPEPGTLALLGFGLSGIAAIRMRQRRRQVQR